MQFIRTINDGVMAHNTVSTTGKEVPPDLTFFASHPNLPDLAADALFHAPFARRCRSHFQTPENEPVACVWWCGNHNRCRRVKLTHAVQTTICVYNCYQVEQRTRLGKKTKRKQ